MFAVRLLVVRSLVVVLMGVGMPTSLLLAEFGILLHDAFDEMPYHVGSSVLSKTGWRDVDVRILLPDERYALEGYGDPENPHRNPKWVAMCLAFSLLGKNMTGLPIDFQIQQQTLANQKFSPTAGCHRSAMAVDAMLRNQARRS